MRSIFSFLSLFIRILLDFVALPFYLLLSFLLFFTQNLPFEKTKQKIQSDLIDFPKPKRNSSSLYSKISGKIKEKKGKQEEKENEKKERKQREKEKKEKEKEEEEEKEEKEEEEEKGKEKENENQEGEEIGVRKRETERKKMTVGSKGKS